MTLFFKGCFDPECCGDAVFGYYGDCLNCKTTTADYSGSVDASDLYESGLGKYVGDELTFICDDCGAVYKTTPKEDDWLEDLELTQVTE